MSEKNAGGLRSRVEECSPAEDSPAAFVHGSSHCPTSVKSLQVHNDTTRHRMARHDMSAAGVRTHSVMQQSSAPRSGAPTVEQPTPPHMPHSATQHTPPSTDSMP